MDKVIIKSQVNGTIVPPSSKSYAQRAIAAALLAQGTTTLCDVELCDDTRSSLRVAQMLGATIETIDDQTYRIAGSGAINPLNNTINIGESGLAARLFTPIAALCDRQITITGHGSIMQRPMDMIVQPLRTLGVEINFNGDNRLPITVKGGIMGGQTLVDGSVSSQFVTGLLMALPLAQADTILKINGLNSIPYIDMTIDLMHKFGIKVEHNNYEEFFIPAPQSYKPIEYWIEGDWSAAASILVAGATAGQVTLKNLDRLSKQADISIIDALSGAGAEITTTSRSITVRRSELNAFEFDATHCPDLFPSLAALAANCNGTSVIKGTNRLTHKESNRTQTIASEFGRMGIQVDTSINNIMRITGGTIRGAVTQSHNDHRIAMAVAVAALNSVEAVTIEGAESVNKSYPSFWDDIDHITVK